MKKTIFFATVIFVVVAMSALFSSCVEKQTEYPNRIVVLMNDNGDTIKVWKGDFYIHQMEGGLVYFYIDGRKTVIKGGILISEDVK